MMDYATDGNRTVEMNGVTNYLDFYPYVCEGGLTIKGKQKVLKLYDFYRSQGRKGSRKYIRYNFQISLGALQAKAMRKFLLQTESFVESYFLSNEDEQFDSYIERVRFVKEV